MLWTRELPATRLHFSPVTAFRLLAEPWWVNLLIFMPPVFYLRWRSGGLRLTGRNLLLAAVFAFAFGFAESAVVVYLRAAAGLLPGVSGTLAEVQRRASDVYLQSESVAHFPPSLFTVEIIRESATMFILMATAALGTLRMREFLALFLWEFAVWDISYYLGLWLLIRWPTSLRSLDVLFLIPQPWVSQIWFPLLVSLLMMLAVFMTRNSRSG